MEIKELEILKTEIERFKTESLKTHVVKVWAESYTNSNPFGYVILEKENNKVWWMKTQAHQLWRMWQAAKTPHEGFVLVDKKQTEDWYLDDHEGMWWDVDGIDNTLCDLNSGEVQAVEHKEYLITESNTVYAAKVWDEFNDQVGFWEFFKTKAEADKAAAYCKAKFKGEPVEAQEQSHDSQNT